MLDLEKMKSAAMAATPGTWWSGHFNPPDGNALAWIGAYFVDCEGGQRNYVAPSRDAEYIATANPSAVLELIERLEAAERDAKRYKWLRIQGLQRAWVSLGTDCDGENYAQFKCEFQVPEPPNLPYEDDEGLEWSDNDFDAAIDAAMKE